MKEPRLASPTTRAFLPLLFLLLVPPAAAQDLVKESAPMVFDPARHVICRNSAIAVGLNRFNGQFWVETNTALPILFSRSNGNTSFSNIRFEGVTFTNNDLHNLQTPKFTDRMPYGTASVLADRAVFKTTLAIREKRLECTQEFIPSIEADYAFIRIRTTLKNMSAVPVKAGLQLMYDLFIGGTDMFDVSVGGRAIQYEEAWRGASVPDLYEGSTPEHTVRIRGRLAAAGLLKPEIFILGYWRYNGYLGAAAWDYQASGLRIFDAATLAQWDEQVILPGDERVITTDYGYIANSDASMRCFAEKVTRTPDDSAYVPNPFEVGATIRNTGFLAIPAIDVEIQLPSGTSLASGETLVKSTAAALMPGDSVTFRWKISSMMFDSDVQLQFPLRMIRPVELVRSCDALVELPGKRLGYPGCENNLVRNGDFSAGMVSGQMSAGGRAPGWTFAYGGCSPDAGVGPGCGEPGFIGMWGNRVVGEAVVQVLDKGFVRGETYLIAFCARWKPGPLAPYPVRFAFRASTTELTGPEDFSGYDMGTSDPVWSGEWTSMALPPWTAPANCNILTVSATNQSSFDNGDSTSHGHIDRICILKADVSSAGEIAAPLTPEAALECSPMPLRSEGIVTCTLSAEGEGTLSLVNALGFEVRVLAQGFFARGRTQTRISTAGLPPGVYLLMLRFSGSLTARRILVGG